jgi:Flp pilus assembly protein TadG
MVSASITRSRRGTCRNLWRDHRGVSALEFALLLPLMLTLYLGGIEIGDALTINRKVTHISSSLADLVTQSRNITDNDMENILDATASIVTPYDDSLLSIVVSGLSIDDDGVAHVAWSDARNDTPLGDNMIVSIPAQLAQPNTFIVTADIHYAYTPTIGYVITGSFDLHDQFFLRPRLSETVGRIP